MTRIERDTRHVIAACLVGAALCFWAATACAAPTLTLSPGSSATVKCASTASPSPAPAPLPCPTVTVTATPAPLPTPTVTVTVTPLPSPTPTTSPSPAPLPSPSLSPAPAGSLFAMVGETVSLEIRPAPSDAELPSVDGLRIEAFEIMTVQTTRPSWTGARVGAYEDPLFPVARLRAGVNYWIDFTPLRSGTFSGVIGGRAFQLKGLTSVMPRRPWHPVYTEMQVARVSQAHGLADQGETLAARCSLWKRYRELLRTHGVEPIKSWVNDYPAVSSGALDLDGYFPAQGCTFREQVLTGAIAEPILWGPNPAQAPSQALLDATKAAITAGTLPTRTRAYVWDEGELDPALSTQALARATQAKPYLGTFITRRPSPTFAPVVSTFCPVQDWATAGMASCYYTSCMAHGCGAGSRSGTPLMVIEGDRVHARAFPWVSQALGAVESLYFAATVSLPTAWDADGQFNPTDGKGNGDGTVLYPGRLGQKGLTDHVPVASIRLKQVRRGVQDLEYLKRAQAAGLPGPGLVRSATDWEKDESRFNAYRESVARALLGL